MAVNGPGVDGARRAANKARDEAQKGLDHVHADKRSASRQSTSDVHRKVLETAKRETWVERSVP
jgi:hypothetical protein